MAFATEVTEVCIKELCHPRPARRCHTRSQDSVVVWITARHTDLRAEAPAFSNGMTRHGIKSSHSHTPHAYTPRYPSVPLGTPRYHSVPLGCPPYTASAG